jgi:hypothetical protein
MRVTVSFADGRVEEFDSDRLTCPDPFPGRSVLSDLVLSLGDDGMWIELDYYDSQGVAEGAMRSGGAGAGGRSSRRQVSWRRRPGWTSTEPRDG